MFGTLVITFFSLVVANICSALMVQAENRNRPHMAGAFEAGWGVLYFVAAKYSLGSLGGHGAGETAITIANLIAGNYLGGYLGTRIGEHLVKDEDEKIIDERLEEAEAALLMAEHTLHELHQEIEVHHERTSEPYEEDEETL
jgi:hypothetical protein